MRRHLIILIAAAVSLVSGCRAARSVAESVDTGHFARAQLTFAASDSLTRVALLDVMTRISVEEPEIVIRTDSVARVVTIRARRAEAGATASVADSSVSAVSASAAVEAADTLVVSRRSESRTRVDSPSLSRIAVILILIGALCLVVRLR